jgi:hypothetical protein
MAGAAVAVSESGMPAKMHVPNLRAGEHQTPE